MYFLAGIKTKYFAPLRILNLFIKFFVSPFVNIALTFFDISFNSLLFKSVLFTKSAIPLLLAKFAIYLLANLAV